MKLVGINPAEVMSKVKKEKSIIEKSLKANDEGLIQKLKKRFSKKSQVGMQEKSTGANSISDLESQIANSEKIKNLLNFRIKHIVIDCSCVNFIDSQGVNAIIQVSIHCPDCYLTYFKLKLFNLFSYTRASKKLT